MKTEPARFANSKGVSTGSNKHLDAGTNVLEHSFNSTDSGPATQIHVYMFERRMVKSFRMQTSFNSNAQGCRNFHSKES